jgi:hypothetical protein
MSQRCRRNQHAHNAYSPVDPVRLSFPLSSGLWRRRLRNAARDIPDDHIPRNVPGTQRVTFSRAAKDDRKHNKTEAEPVK